jgi:Zn-dependent peptidase ImmA (M78 family)
MTYVPDAVLEARAAVIWRRQKLSVGFDAEALVDDLALGLMWDAIDDADDGLIFGALWPTRHLVLLNERHRDLLEENAGLRRFTLAHEIAHWIVHVRPTEGQMSFCVAERIWCRERSRDPVEIQAERFASYLLMPTDLLKPRIPPSPWRGWPVVRELAAHFGASSTAMIVRLEVGGVGSS